MRMRLACLVALSVLLAGCAERGGGDSPTPTPPADPTPTDPTPEPSDPTPDPGTPGEPEAPQEPEPPAPPPASKMVYEGSHDFTENDPSNEKPVEETFEVPEGYATLVINLTLRAKSVSGVPATVTVQNPKVTLLDPAGEVAFTKEGTGEAREESISASAGTWKVRYENLASAEGELDVWAHP